MSASCGPPRRPGRRALGALSVWLVCAWGELSAQRLAVARWDEKDGLPQSQVQALALDAKGFLWVATRNGGLSRFDGSAFRPAGAIAGLPDRRVDALVAGEDGVVWAAGKAVYGRFGRTFTPVLEGSHSILARGAGDEVLAAGDGGVVSIRRQDGQVRPHRLDASPATAVAGDAAGVWIGRAEGLERLDRAGGAPRHVELGSPVSALLPSGTGVIAGTHDGLFRVGPDGGVLRLALRLPDPRVDALGRDARGRVWAGTRKGAVRLSAGEGTVELGPEDGLPAVRVVSIQPGPGGEVWLGSDGGGLFRFAPTRFAVVGPEAGLDELIPMSITEEPGGALWIATARGELARLRDGRFTTFGPADGLPRADRFRDLAIGPDGRLDVAWRNGLVRRERDGAPFRTIPVEPGNRVAGGIAVAAGETWLATARGLRVVRGDRLEAGFPPPLGTEPIDVIAPDGAEGLLVASQGEIHAVDVARRRTTPIARVGPLLGGEAPWHLARSRDGSVWAAALGGAVRVSPDGRSRVYRASNGLPDDSVDAVVAAPDGDVWLTTDKGIVRVAPDGTPLRSYSFSDGLPAREGIVRSALVDRRGHVWFGLVGALVRYDPAADEGVVPPPVVEIERLAPADRRRGGQETTAVLSVLEFADPRGVKVSFRLSPVATDFSTPQETRTVRWASLPPGDYLLSVRAVDRAGRAGPEARAAFTLEPRWHETTAARLLLILLALGAGAALPATLRAGASAVTRLQARLLDLLREAGSPRYVPIEDDPFAPGSPAPLLTQQETLDEIVGTIRRAWNRHAVIALLGPPGLGKSTVAADLEAGAGGSGLVVVAVPPARRDRRPLLSAVASALRARGMVDEAKARSLAAGEGSAALTRAVAEVSSLLLERKADLLLVEDDPHPASPEAAAARALLASTVLTAGPHVSYLVVRDVEPSLFCAEEPDLARVARLVRIRPASVERAAFWLEETAGTRLRFAPGVARAAVREVSAEPDRLRALGSALVERARAQRTNRVGNGLLRAVLLAWQEAPPPFLGALWARLSSAERAVAAALGQAGGRAASAVPVGLLTSTLKEGGFDLGPIEVGALVPRLAEAGIVVRSEEAVSFRDPVVARFVMRHRPLSEELRGGAEVIGPYELLEQVGSGGMGSVYRARRLDDRRLVALKVVHPHHLATPEMRRRFVREGEIGVRVSHPGVVKVLERGEAAGRAYIAMEFVEGPTIRGLVTRAGPLPVRPAVRVLGAVADAVAALHAAGIVHRDIKSENVIVMPSGAPKLLDFGLARTAESTRQTQSGKIVGTPDSMAPEQVRGEPPGPAADVWALGVVLYEMLAGCPAFLRGETMATFKAILEEEPTPPGRWRPSVPGALDAIVLSALRKDAAARCPSAEALRDALDALLPSLPEEELPDVPPDDPAEERTSPGRRDTQPLQSAERPS